VRNYNCSVFLFCVFPFILFTFQSCTNPISPANDFTLSVTDATCTEAWLNLHVNKVPAIVTINKNGALLNTIRVTIRDTTIYDSTLSPGKTYTYQAISGSTKSETVTAKTMDTTSHNWSFQTFYFGGASSSCLNDVAIINDTLAYAVGSVYVRDLTGAVDQYPYCLAVWNGKEWRTKRLYYKDKDYQGNEFTSVLSNIRGILAYSNTDIWFAAGSIFHWNGKDTIVDFSYHILTPSGLLPGINKLWGISSSNLYGVGNSGAIAHYTNGSWQKIESGTTLDIYDIYGSGNQIFVIASSYNPSLQERKLLQIDPSTHLVSAAYDNGLAISLRNLWFIPNKLYLCGGDGLFYKKDINAEGSWHMYPVTNYYTDGISGNDVNDIFVSGDYLELVHFNGSTWHNYRDEIPQVNGAFRVKVKGNFLIAVGLSATGQAIAVTGNRK
jgi:hypothetical protein